MQSRSEEPMTEPGILDDRGTAKPGDDLPAVEPPTAGFIVQLFGIPLAIVAVAVLVWLLFGKIAASHRTPDDYLEDLRSPNFERRWSAARDLASILPHHEEWQNDEQFAKKLAAELESELTSGMAGPREIRYVHFIAQSLGEFRSLAGVPALQKALTASTERDVREAAVMGLGKLADRLGRLDDDSAVGDLIAATRDEDPAIRVKATWILGRTANSNAVPGLVPLLNDSDPEVRLNAASSLARLGSDASLETLGEMLDPDQLLTSLKARGLSESQISSQMVAIPWASLQSLSILLDKAPETDIENLRGKIEYLANQGGRRLSVSAKELLIKMNNRK